MNLFWKKLEKLFKSKKKFKQKESAEHKLYQKTIDFYGVPSQVDKAIEECGELIVALQRYKQARPTNVPEEIADVKIMCNQLSIIFTGVEKEKSKKLFRLKKRIEAGVHP